MFYTNSPELSDVAASDLLDMLYELTTAFENHYLHQLKSIGSDSIEISRTAEMGRLLPILINSEIAAMSHEHLFQVCNSWDFSITCPILAESPVIRSFSSNIQQQHSFQ